MRKTVFDIFKTREDISDYLFHFTKGSGAKETLKSILKDKKLKDKRSRGYICFSESPVTLLAPMFDLFKQWDNPLYAPYGIGIKKDYIYNIGGRQAIYGDENERTVIPQSLKWRFVSYNPKCCDFTWLREWRVPVSEIELSLENCFVIVDQNREMEELRELLMELDDIEVDAQPEDGGVLTEYTGYFSRKYKSISLEDIAVVNKMSKNELQEVISTQPSQDSIFLGSTWG